MDTQAPITVISFFAGGWEYRERAQALASQCESHGVPHRIRERPDLGWLRNTHQKPGFILESLDQLRTPVLWIDADGGLYKDPVEARALAANGVDWAGAERAGHRLPWKWHVGVMMFNDSEPARDLLRRWMAYSESDPRADLGTDDWTFELVRRECWPEHLKSFALPATYHCINDPTSGAVAGIGISRSASKMNDSRRVHAEFRR